MSHHLTGLPIEILLTIIGYLGQPGRDLVQCTLINRQFYRMANPCLWRHINFNPNHDLQPFLTSLTLAKHSLSSVSPSSSIQSIELSRIHLTDAWLTGVLRHVPQLTSLVLDNTNRQFSYRDMRSTLDQLGERCPGLQCLEIRHMPLTPAFFQSLGQHCHQLRTFRCTTNHYVDRIPSNIFTKFFKACPLIDTLELDFNDNLLGHRRRRIHPWDTINKFTHNLAPLAQLKRLIIGRSPRGMLHRAIQTSVSTHTPCWPHLTSLALQIHCPLSDDHVIALVRDCCARGQLLHLQVWYAHLTNAALVTLAKLQPHLQSLDLSFSSRCHDDDGLFDAVGLGKLIGQCLQLNVIRLTRCWIKKGHLADDGGDDVDATYFSDVVDREAINKIRRIHGSGARVST